MTPFIRYTPLHRKAVEVVAVRARLKGWTVSAIKTRLRRLRDHPRPTQAILIWVDRIERDKESYQGGLPDELRTRSGDLPSSRLNKLVGDA